MSANLRSILSNTSYLSRPMRLQSKIGKVKKVQRDCLCKNELAETIRSEDSCDMNKSPKGEYLPENV